MSFGTSKHRKSGNVVNSTHFTGKKGGKTKRKHGLTKKQRQKKKGSHEDKYAE